MKLKFHTLDVFTNRKFAGNPLAVVLGADDLTTAQMQTITREFNLSETTFVMKPKDPANTAMVRIFFPGGEMPFAGHPTLGTALLLAEINGLDEVRLELPAGLTPAKITRGQGGFSGQFTAPIIPRTVPLTLPPVTLIAQALNLPLDEIGFDGHGICAIEGGPCFFFVPVKSRETLTNSRVFEPQWSEMLSIMRASETKTHLLDAAYLYTRGGDGKDTSFRARMFAPTSGILEDPATGSATALLAAQLVKAEKLKDGAHTWQLEQGYEMGRPSDLRLEADVVGGALKAVRVGGSAVRVMSGEIEF